MVELVDTERLITKKNIHDFETVFSRDIPSSFKNHYLACNGGHPEEGDAEAGRWGLPIHGFNPIKHGKVTIEMLIDDFGCIEPENERFGAWEKFQYIPFAYDGGANPIFLSLRDSDYGSVYIYGQDGGAIKKISDSFEEFRRRLYKE